MFIVVNIDGTERFLGHILEFLTPSIVVTATSLIKKHITPSHSPLCALSLRHICILRACLAGVGGGWEPVGPEICEAIPLP